jgi:hypothetical protein
MLTVLACSESPITEPSDTSVAPSPRLHPYLRTHRSADLASTRFYRSSALVSLGTANLTSRGSVLLIADEDGPSTTALANSVASAGYVVTVRPAPEYTWDGTNPSLEGYDLVIHLNGNTFFEGQALSATAQSTLVDFVRAGGAYIGGQWNSYEATTTQGDMSDLVLAGFPGLPEENCVSCMITYSIVPGQEAHALVAGIPSEFTFDADGHMGGPQVGFDNQPSTVIMQLPSGTPGVLVRNLGSGKVVNFNFAANYNLAGDGHTLQDANVRQLYVNAVQWALDGSTPTPTKIPATITLTDPVATFDGTAKSVSVTTNPAGLTGLTVTYSQDGFPVAAPVNAGVYQVLATLDHAEYAAPQATGTLTIGRATPVIQWTPATVTAGEALSSAQLNADAVGIDGGSLAGEYFYLPGTGTVLSGTQPVSVEFQPISGNYRNAIGTVTVTVVPVVVPSRLKFTGFFRPVYNLPAVNTMPAGRAVPVIFSVLGSTEGPILQSGSPSSEVVTCSASETEKPVTTTVDASASRLVALGTTYTYTWKTNAGWAGTCRKLVLTLVDGSRHEALFRFSKSVTQPVAKRVEPKSNNGHRQNNKPKQEEQQEKPKKETRK